MRTKHEKVEATVDDLHRRMSSIGSEVTRGEDVNSSAHSLNSLGAVPADAAPVTDSTPALRVFLPDQPRPLRLRSGFRALMTRRVPSRTRCQQRPPLPPELPSTATSWMDRRTAYFPLSPPVLIHRKDDC